MSIKSVVLLFILAVYMPGIVYAQFSCSGLDRADIYLNKKLVATATPADAPVVKLDTLANADTIVIHAYTDWGGLKNSTLDIKNESGELMNHVNSTGNTGYEAVFTYIFNKADINDTHLKSFVIFLNLLCERSIEPEKIATFRLRAK